MMNIFTNKKSQINFYGGIISFIVLMCLKNPVLAQVTSTKLGTDALYQQPITETYKIDKIIITNPGVYTYPKVNLNVSGSATITWISKYVDVNSDGFSFWAEICSNIDLGTFTPSISNPNGISAPVNFIVTSAGYSNGLYKYYVEGYNDYSPTPNFVPTITLSPAEPGYEMPWVYFNQAGKLVVDYSDDYNDNNYSTNTPPSITLTHNAVATVVMQSANSENTAIGYQSLKNNTSTRNTAIGASSLKSNTTGSNNFAAGSNSLYSNTTGAYNLAIGNNALYTNNGYHNIAMGTNSLYNNNSGVHNLAMGLGALYSNTTGSTNIGLGLNSLYNNTTGYNNIANGTGTLYYNTTGAYNIATGPAALSANISGNFNIAIGNSTLARNTIGYNNIAIGNNTLANNISGYYNIASGDFSLNNNITGNNNIANGYQALYANTTGNNNIANGQNALRSNTTGINNVAYGVNSLKANTTGGGNTASANGALARNTTGNDNTATGTVAMSFNTSGNNNSAYGFNAGYDSNTGSQNSFFGYNSGRGITTGSYNTIIGNTSGLAANLSNTVILADGAGNQRFYSPSSGNVLLGYGNNPADNGYKLDVNGTGRFAGTVQGADGVNANDFVTKQQMSAATGSYLSTSGGTVAGALLVSGYSADSPNLLVGDGQYGFSSLGSKLYAYNAGAGFVVKNKNSGGEQFKVNGDASVVLPVNTDASFALKFGTSGSPGNINVPVGGVAGGYNIDFHTWRDIRSDQIGARIRAERINLYQHNNALVQGMDLAFSTSPGVEPTDISEKMRIRYDGNVGIGTTSPNAKLEISSHEVALNTKSQFSGNMIIKATGGNRSTTAGAQLEFVIPANTDGSNPWGQGRILTVAGNTGTGDATGKMVIGTRRAFKKVDDEESNWYYGDDIVVDGGGKIGLGTITPVSKLHVYDGNVFISKYDHSNSPTIDLAIGDSDSGIDWINDGVLSLKTDGVEVQKIDHGKVVFSSTSKIGIGTGTATLTEALNVNGNILTEGVKVNPTEFPDYVFKSQYKLRPLKEVEKFVKENSHLPEVPSEAEVKKNGLELGEMSVTLLKKIEELTLYMIEKDKQLEKANQQIQDLSKKVKKLETKR